MYFLMSKFKNKMLGIGFDSASTAPHPSPRAGEYTYVTRYYSSAEFLCLLCTCFIHVKGIKIFDENTKT